MGAWDTDPFGNDTAGDWVFGLDDLDDLSLIESTIQKLHDVGSEYLDASDAEEAIAAADTLSRLKGHFYVRNAYTESLDKWVETHKIIPPQKLVDSAIKAIDRILTAPSELLELWEESDDLPQWKTHLEELKKRLT